MPLTKGVKIILNKTKEIYMKKLLSSVSTITTLAFLTANAAFAQSLNVPEPGPVSVNNIGFVISAIVGVMIIVAAVLAFLFLILGGIQWITSGGDKAGMEAARNKITAAIVGLIVVAAAWALMFLIGQFIGFNILAGQVDIPTINQPTRGNQ